MLNDSPKKSWRASNITPQYMSIHIGPQSNSLAIFAVDNVQSMVGSPVAPSSYSFYDGVAGYDGVTLYQSPSTTLPINWDFTSADSFWEDFISVDGFELELLVTPDPGAFATVGIVTSGTRIDFTQNPSPGFSHGLENYSIVKTLSNGGFYVKNRDVVETFAGQIVLSRTDWLEFSEAVKTIIKSSPTAWYLMDAGNENEEFLTYARLAAEPSGARNAPDIVTVSMSLVEMV
jgi:hypothetical protein